MNGAALALAWLWLGAQDPAPAPLDPAARQRAEALLQQHGKRAGAAKVLTAAYTQRRTTALSREPLQSEGTLVFRRAPAAVRFTTTRPRATEVRLAERVYEVYRPQRRQLERFHLDGPELPQGLFAALGGDLAYLQRGFAVVGCAPVAGAPTQVAIELQPTDAAVRTRLQQLRLVVAAADGALLAVAYRDGAGDLVEIALRQVQFDPPDAPATDLPVPAGTTVVEHAAKSAPPR